MGISKNVPTFRARSINVNEKIVIENEYNLITKDTECSTAIVRSVKTEGTGMERKEEEEKHVQEAISNPETNIPIPHCRIVDDYESFGKKIKGFSYPRQFIQYDGRRPSVEYDMDEEDEALLSEVNQVENKLSEDKFEFLIDRFEKEAETLEELPSLSHLETLFSAMPADLLSIVYNYWIKRRAEYNRPLIPSVWAPNPRDSSPYLAFRPRNVKPKKKGKLSNGIAYETYLQMWQLRKEMEKSRTLLEMVRKREKLKLEKLLLTQQLLDLQTDLINKSNDTVQDRSETQDKPVESNPLPPAEHMESITDSPKRKAISKRRANTNRPRPKQESERSKKPVFNSITLRGGKRIRDKEPTEIDSSLAIETSTSKKLKGMTNPKPNSHHQRAVESR